jgi:D-galactarolactone cycloisomerase
MFSEDAAVESRDAYRALRQAVDANSRETFLADGESGTGEGALADLIASKIVQISQPDIRTLGLSAYLRYAAGMLPAGALIAPHVWPLYLGFLETALLGMTVPNFSMLEDCRLSSDVVRLPGLRLSEGLVTLLPYPGLGIVIDEAAYEKECAPGQKTVRLP